jgi:hypothetical protein
MPERPEEDGAARDPSRPDRQRQLPYPAQTVLTRRYGIANVIVAHSASFR